MPRACEPRLAGPEHARTDCGLAIVTAAVSDDLSHLASLSLSFVGFSAAVVTLRGALGGTLSGRHLRPVRLHTEGGLLVTVPALVPTFLDLPHLPASLAWQLSSVAAASIFTVLLVIQFRRRRSIEPGPFALRVVVVYVIAGAVAGLWFNVAESPSRRMSALAPSS
jgi:hypothetical protein